MAEENKLGVWLSGIFQKVSAHMVVVRMERMNLELIKAGINVEPDNTWKIIGSETACTFLMEYINCKLEMLKSDYTRQ